MLIYWLLLALPVGGAFIFTQEGGRRESPASKLSLVLFIIIYALVAGLRYQTGGDWDTYWENTEQIRNVSLAGALAVGDIGFQFVSYISLKLGFDLYGINMFCATVLVIGCARLAWRTPAPWIAMAAAVPYILIVIGMGYIRQGAAIGFILLAFVGLVQGSWVRGMIYFVLAVLMHVAAIIVLPIVALVVVRRNPAVLIGVAIVGAMLFFFLLSGARLEGFEYGYVEQQYSSSGTLVRLLMNLVPGVLFLATRRFIDAPRTEKMMWTLVSWISVIFVGLFFFVPSSTALDRAGLFFAPLQIFVFGYVPQIMRATRRTNFLYILLLVLYFVGVQLIWLMFAQHSYIWVPYHSIFSA